MDRLEIERVKAEAATAACRAEAEGHWPPACPYGVGSAEGKVFLAQVDAYAARLLASDSEVPDIEDVEDGLAECADDVSLPQDGED